MAASEALSTRGESTVIMADPTEAPADAEVPRLSAVPPRWGLLLPITQLVAVVLGVMAIIWNQQQTTDTLRSELREEINHVEVGLREEIKGVESELRAEIKGVESELRAEIGGLHAEVSENGQRLARIEGLLRISAPGASSD